MVDHLPRDLELVSVCKDKLASFRVKELKDVLSQLFLSKQGRKQDLMDRILALFLDGDVQSTSGSAKKKLIPREGIVKIIDETYRKMHSSEDSDLATKGQGGSGILFMEPKTECEDSLTSNVRVCCPCSSSLVTDAMVQCTDSTCQVKQHISCVIIQEKPSESSPQTPRLYYCEMCRIKRADPFWVTVAHMISPVKFPDSVIQTEGMNTLHNVEQVFELTRADKDLLKKIEYDAQAWCILLNDNVTFRIQWPQSSDLQVNGVPVRTTNRHESQFLGANGRDSGALITSFLMEGTNRISLSGSDSRIFSFGVRLVKRRVLKEVLSLIPKETDGELLEDAVARVRRCIGGGMAIGDEDSDLEVIEDSITVHLRCPMSGSRMNIAGRFKPCAHMGCFDLVTFVELNEQYGKWQCPICVKNYSLEDVIIDPYFNRITTMMKECADDIVEVEIKCDGSWASKTRGDIAEWHFPDGSLYPATNEASKTRSRNINTYTNSGLHSYRGSRKFNISPNYPMEEGFEDSDSDSDLENKNHSFGPMGDAEVIVLSDSE